jgi:putative SOS response-associated peptidase YedK
VSIGRKVFNARSDTAVDKTMFRTAMKREWRCIIPADAFYEWKVAPPGKQPYAVARADSAPLALAGLWEHWRDADGVLVHSFTILTTGPIDPVGELRDRVTAIPGEQDFPQWPGEEEGHATALMRPCLDAAIERATLRQDRRAACQRPFRNLLVRVLFNDRGRLSSRSGALPWSDRVISHFCFC